MSRALQSLPALWIALRTLEERAALSHRLAERGRLRHHERVDEAFTQRAREAEQEANEIRALLRTRSSTLHSVPDDTSTIPAGPGTVVPMKDGDED